MQQYDIYEIVEDMLKTVCQDNNKITLNQIREYTNIMIQDIDMMMYEFYNNNGEY